MVKRENKGMNERTWKIISSKWPIAISSVSCVVVLPWLVVVVVVGDVICTLNAADPDELPLDIGAGKRAEAEGLVEKDVV